MGLGRHLSHVCLTLVTEGTVGLGALGAQVAGLIHRSGERGRGTGTREGRGRGRGRRRADGELVLVGLELGGV